MGKIKNKLIVVNPIIDVLIVFFVSFIPKFVIAYNSNMISTVSDEVSALSIAAFAAGYDWRDVVSSTGYYGIGYIVIFFPLFKAGVSAVTIYRIILSVNAVLIGLTGVICYAILRRFFSIENRLIKIAISSVCGCMSIFSTSITRARNEDIYLLCGWIAAYLILCILDETAKNKKRYEVFLAVIFMYSLSVHTRAVTYFIVFVAVCVLYRLSFKKNLVSKLFWIISISGYAIIEFLLKIYQQWVWNSNSVANTSLGGTVSRAFSRVSLDFTMVKSVLMIILGQFFTAFSLSGGIFVIAFVVLAIFVLKCIKNRDNLRQQEISLLVLGVMYGMMTLITICGQSITWGVNVYSGLITGSTEYVYAYKAFTYMRYMGSYVPVLVMTALVISYFNWDIWKRACRFWMPTTFIVLFVFWLYAIIPYVKNTKSNMEFFITIISLPTDEGNSIFVWYKMFLLLFIFAFSWMFLCNKKTFVLQLLIIGVFYTSYERLEIFNNYIFVQTSSIATRVDAGYSVLQRLHDKILADDMDICVIDAQRTSNQNWYVYQFMNYDMHIIPGSEDDITETELVFSNKVISEYLSDEYTAFQLDDNEWLYSKNSEYSELVREMGYEELTME